jgi:hypothetical protein
MVAYVPPKKNDANGFIFYTALSSRTADGTFLTNPTLASGDVKVSIDGAAYGNLGTLPAVTPAAGTSVKVTLAQGEINGDNIFVKFQDAAGAEWCDKVFNFQTVTRQIDDLAFPSTSGRGIDVSVGGEVGLDWANVGSPTTAVDLSGTTIKTTQVVASVTGAVGSVTGAVGSVTGSVGGNVTGSVGSVVGAVGSVTGLTASDVGAIKTKTDSLTFTKAGEVDANIQSVNDVTVTGNGQSGTEWGP